MRGLAISAHTCDSFDVALLTRDLSVNDSPDADPSVCKEATVPLRPPSLSFGPQTRTSRHRNRTQSPNLESYLYCHLRKSRSQHLVPRHVGKEQQRLLPSNLPLSSTKVPFSLADCSCTPTSCEVSLSPDHSISRRSLKSISDPVMFVVTCRAPTHRRTQNESERTAR